jgi:hypothetical protein
MTNYINGLFLGTIFPSQTLAGAIQVFKGVWPDAPSTIESVEVEVLDPLSDLTWNRAATFGPRENHNIRTNYSFNLNKTNVQDISFNDYKIVLSNSSANGYTLTQYMDAINTSFTNINNKTKVSIYNPNGDFKLSPLPASINSENIFDLKNITLK